MPIIGLLASAVVSGLFLWLVWGNGLDYLGWQVDRRAAKGADRRRTKAAVAARERAARAPLDAATDPREAALILFYILLSLRDPVDDHHRAEVERLAHERLDVTEKVRHWCAIAEFAAAKAPSVDIAIEQLAPRIRDGVGAEERGDFIAMLRDLASLDGPPTRRQNDFIEVVRQEVGA